MSDAERAALWKLAEPNGLYMPASADGTWVICLDPSDKSLKPVYVEPRIMVYPFEMPAAD